MTRLKVYFYDNSGYEVFTRIYYVESVSQLINVLFETLFNNADVYSYYIETVEQEAENG